MRNIALLVEYDGGNYHGFQRQINGISIQQVLEEAIEKLTGERTKLHGSGRTDAGVHARGQVVNFMTGSTIPTVRMPYAINSLLPRDILVKGALEAPPDFHARFSAQKKHYAYYIHNGQFQDVFSRRYAWHVRERLDTALMQMAGSCLLGTHDFRGFSAGGSRVKSTVRTIYALEVRPVDSKIVINVEADGFLYNMVRIITGTLVEVGKGKMPLSQVEETLATGQRKLAGPTAPPHGLFLMHVNYADISFLNS